MKPTILTPRDIAQHCKWEVVQKYLRFFYGRKWNGAEEVFDRIKNAPKKKHKDPEEFLVISYSTDILEAKTEGFDINGFYDIATNKYSLSFRKWNEISNIPISDTAINSFAIEAILAHLIYEMTWYGTEKDSQKYGKGLKDAAKKIKKTK